MQKHQTPYTRHILWFSQKLPRYYLKDKLFFWHPQNQKKILTAFPTLHWWHICIVSPSYIIERILFPVSMGGWSGSMEKSSNKRWTNVSLTVTRSRYSSPPGPFIRGRGRIYLSSTSGMLMLHHTKITHIIMCLLWIGFSELVLREHWKARILSGQWSVPKENVKVGLYGKASATYQ